MSAHIPLSSSLPPPAWGGHTLDAAPAHRPLADAGASWFATPASARTLSVQFNAHAQGDVDSWANALVSHLIEPVDAQR